ncbi:MAG TPA: serine hydrolase [Gemmatimonadales bacterium]|nr:serine hydrolase [Gemmatimonadales bacterium]
MFALLIHSGWGTLCAASQAPVYHYRVPPTTEDGWENGGLEGGFDRLTRHDQHSVTKSVTSILIGIAIDQQLISSVEERVATFFPEFADLFADSAKAGIRLKHLLSMTAGLSWDEWTRPIPILATTSSRCSGATTGSAIS